MFSEDHFRYKMTILSKLSSFPFGCHEIAHTWDKSCSRSWLDLGIAGLIQAAKIYLPLFVIARLIRSRRISTTTVKKVAKETAQSSFFLGANCYFFLSSFCIVRQMLPFVPVRECVMLAAYLGSQLAILIERENRRDALAVYMTNVASETLYNVLRERGHVPHIPNGLKILATIVLTATLYLYKLGKCEGLLGQAAKALLGTAEVYPTSTRLTPTAGAKLLAYICRLIGCKPPQRVTSPVPGSVCKHPASCLSYTCQGISESLLLGVAVQTGVTCAGALLRFFSTGRLPQRPAALQFFQLAASLGTVTGLFRLVSCLLRRTRGHDAPWHAVPAGMIASVGLHFYSSPSLMLYLFWKCLEAWYHYGAEEGHLPRAPGAVPVLYALSTGVVLSAAVLEAHQIRPSYWRFLNTLTDGFVAKMNWPLIGREAGTDTTRLDQLRRYKPVFDARDVRISSIPVLLELGQLK